MRSRASRAFLGALLAVVLAGAARADHKDERIGFSLQTPRGWTEIPMNVDERWKVAKYISDKTSRWTSKEIGFEREHKANMEMIAFVAEAMKERIKVEKKENADGGIDWRIFTENPYRDYKDFLSRRYSGGGWFVLEEKETKHGEIPVTCYEIKVEKNSWEGPKRLSTRIFHLKDVDVAVQFEILEGDFEKLKNEFQRCLRSFKSVPRTEGALYEPSTPGGDPRWWDQDRLTPEEREKQRHVMEQKAHDKASKGAPDGWVVKKMGRFLVVNHADEKLAKRIVEQAEAVWDWLDATFPFVGEKEYVRAPIIRICKDQAEQAAYFSGGDFFSRSNIEIITAPDHMGKGGWEMEYVNRRVMEIWFGDKDWDLFAAMPGWLSIGLSEFIGDLHVKNGKVDFGTDVWDRDEIRELQRDGKLTALRDLLMMSQSEFSQDYWSRRIEGCALIDFFVNGQAAKSKRTKSLLAEYMRNVQSIAEQIEKEQQQKKGDGSGKPKTEAEEDAWFKQKRDDYKAGERRLLEEAFQRTFVGWSQNEWRQFEESYRKSL